MYAVVHTGGKQYKVQVGETFRVEKIAGDVGTSVSFDRVLLLSDGNTVKIGQPLVENATVQGHIVEQDRAKKILVFKYKRRKRYRRKQGHRQSFTAIKIDTITAKGLELSPQEAESTSQPIETSGTEAAQPQDMGAAQPEVTEAAQPQEMGAVQPEVTEAAQPQPTDIQPQS